MEELTWFAVGVARELGRRPMLVLRRERRAAPTLAALGVRGEACSFRGAIGDWHCHGCESQAGGEEKRS